MTDQEIATIEKRIEHFDGMQNVPQQQLIQELIAEIKALRPVRDFVLDVHEFAGAPGCEERLRKATTLAIKAAYFYLAAREKKQAA